MAGSVSSVVSGPGSASASAAASKEPSSSRMLSKSEQILVLRASFLNGSKFPPWNGEPAAEEFILKENESLFVDDTVFSLSPFQQKVFAGWERPDVALAQGDATTAKATMDHVITIDLVQDASTDCSVVASLCSGVARASRGHARLLRPVLFPQHQNAGVPIISDNGKYIVRLNFNGCYRRVVIDDRLPSSRTERVIHVIDRLNPMLLWPALVEKAYLKIRGGYDFPGSNSATDLWIITGWIPEQVFLQSDDLDFDAFWKRVFNAFVYGDVLVTMGTGKMSRRLEKEVGLAGEHDYAIIDMAEIRGQKLMLVKNPWCEGTNWHRVPRRRSKVDLDILAASHSTLQLDEDNLPMQSPRDLLNADDQLSPGTFWMDMNNAAQYFESIYLNWNPSLFTSRHDLHFAWDLTGAEARGQHASLRNNPQFSVGAHEGGTIWILLCRHLRNDTAQDSTPPSIDLAGFIAVSAFATDGERIKLAGRAICKSNFVDSPQMLLKLHDCQPSTQYTVLPLEQELPSANHTFTISAFSNSALKLDHASPAYPYAVKCSASWNRDTAGGNAHSPTYSTNPQFTVTISRNTKVSVLLETTNEALNVHVKMVHGQGKRVLGARNRDVIFDSSDYHRRCCIAQSKERIEPGTYTIICSTYEPQQLGDFDVLLESDEPVGLTLLPREDAGRLENVVKAVFPKDITKIAANLTPKRLANIYFKARRGSGSDTSRTALRMTIEQGHGVYRRILATSGEAGQLTNDVAPLRLEEFDISPEMLRYGELWLILERICVAGQTAEQVITIQCFVDQMEAVEFGQWRALDE